MPFSPSIRHGIAFVFLLFFSVVGLLAFLYGKNYWSDRLYVHYVLKNALEYRRAPISDAYVDQLAYGEGDSLILYAHSSEKDLFPLYLYDILGHIQDSLSFSPQAQEPGDDPSVAGFGFTGNAPYIVPPLKPGLYTWGKVAPFVIRGPENAPITILYPSNTIQAYNTQGGKSFYSMFSEASDTISFMRPTFPAISFMIAPMLEWLYQQDYPLRFITDMDLESSSVLDSTQLLVIIGHSEYWTGNARASFDAFVDRGGNALILSGNTLWWKVRYSPDKKQLICFKNGNDPLESPEDRTGNWADHLSKDPLSSIGVSFALGGYGRKYAVSKDGFTLLDTTHILFRKWDYQGTPFIHVPTKEYDGQYVLYENEQPFLDSSRISFHRFKLLGFDRASHGYDSGTASIMQIQKTDSSGVILNFPSTDWCSPYGMGGKDGEKIRALTARAIELLKDQKKTTLLWE